MTDRLSYRFSLVLFLTIVPGMCAHAITHELKPLDDSEANGRAAAINDEGWVVGERETHEGHVQAFLWKPDAGLITLGTLGGAGSRAYAINRNGVVVGEAVDSNGVTRAFCWDEEHGMRALDTMDDTLFSAAYAVNENGAIVGCIENMDGMHAVLWREEGMTILPRLPGTGNIQALDINRRGDVIGHIKTGSDESFGSHAFYFTDAISARNLTSFMLITPYSGSAAVAINNRGEVAGYTMMDARIQAFRYNRRSGISALNDGGATYSTAFDINDHAHVVGSYIASYEADESACLWINGNLIDLNNIDSHPPDWWLIQATGINNVGCIIGNGLQGERNRPFILIPTN